MYILFGKEILRFTILGYSVICPQNFMKTGEPLLVDDIAWFYRRPALNTCTRMYYKISNYKMTVRKKIIRPRSSIS